jgi:hypothetical protein
MELGRFIKIYSFLPLEERNLTIVVIDGEPINWKRAYDEIKNKTPLGKRIFNILVKRGLI